MDPDPDWIRIRISLQPQPRDPDPDTEKMNTDPKHCLFPPSHFFLTPLTIFPSPLLPCSLLPFSPSFSSYSLLPWAFFALSHPLPSLFPATFLSFLLPLLSSSVALSHPLFSLFPFTFSPTCSLHLLSSMTPFTISPLPLSFPS